MRTTTLGSDGPDVGVIGLGCMGMTASYDLETPRDDATSIAVIHQALDMGMTLIDTADAYGPFTNEELVGKALAGGYRERAVLATKVGLVMGDTGAQVGPGTASPGAGRNGRPEHVRESIDSSLRRLNTDHVELYQLHRVDPEVPIEETWGAMAEAVAAGKALHIGLSEVTVGEIRRAQTVHPVTSVQSELSLWTRDVLAEVLPFCKEEGIALIPFSPLGRGFLTGRFSSFDDLRRTTFAVSCPAFSRMRFAPTSPSWLGCERSLNAPGSLRRRWRWPGFWPRAPWWCRSQGPRRRSTSRTTRQRPVSSSTRHRWPNSTPSRLPKEPATDTAHGTTSERRAALSERRMPWTRRDRPCS